jgi:serine/threonine protein kinase/WD40 repeat protein
MNPTTHWSPRRDPSGPETGAAEAAADDPRVVRALEEYLAALEAGARPERDALLARHPDIALALADCLDGLELMQALAHPALPAPGPAAPDTPALAPLGDYRLLREVGRGGMGVVYEADQLSLGRRVALKVLPFAAALDPRQLDRFHNEARAAASLHHPHIVPVFAVGCARGVHYYAMQFIEGESLATLIRGLRQAAGLAADDPPAGTGSPAGGVYSGGSCPAQRGTAGPRTDPEAPPARAPNADTVRAGTTLGAPGGGADRDYFRTVARLGIQAAEALEHAHQLGVVHRDVKPANLLLDQHGRLWVADFGLAQFCGHPGLTLTGDVLGTLRYMSPEQALARRVLLDHRTDVYSLGATLYELLTLRPAVPGNDRAELLRQITQQEPVAPRRLAPALPPELETIVLKTLAKNPEERYGTAQELADDLQRFLDDRPIRARRPGLLRRLRKGASRHKTPLASLAVAVVLLLAGFSFGALDYARRQHDLARRQVLFAQERERHQRETAGKLFHSLLVGAAAVRQARQPGYRAQVWAMLHEAADQDGAGDHRDEIRRQVLACLGDPIGLGEVRQKPSAGRGSPLPPPAFRRLLPTESAKAKYALSRDGERFVLVSPSGTLRLYGKDGTAPLAETRLPLGGVYELQFTPNGRLLAAGCEEGVMLWFVPTLIPCWFARGGPVLSVAIDPAGRFLASAGRKVEVWSLGSNRLTASFPLPCDGAGVEFSADGKSLLSGKPGQVHSAWSLTDTPEKHTLPGHRGGVPALAFSPDGRTIASGSKDRLVKIWDAGSGALAHICRGHNAAIEALAFSPDGALLATGDFQGVLCLWDPHTGTEVARVDARPAPPGQIWRLQFAAAGDYLAAAGDRGVAAWQVLTGEGPPRLRECLTLPHPGAIDLALHPAGTALVFLDRTSRLMVSDLTGAAPPTTLNFKPRPEVRSLHFDAAGERLTFLTLEGTLGLYDWQRGVVTRTIGQRAFQLAVSQGGWVATSNPAHELVVYELAAGKEVVTLPPEANDVWSLAWSPDGNRVAVGLSDGGLAVWDLEEVRARLEEFGIPLDRPPGPGP